VKELRIEDGREEEGHYINFCNLDSQGAMIFPEYFYYSDVKLLLVL